MNNLRLVLLSTSKKLKTEIEKMTKPTMPTSFTASEVLKQNCFAGLPDELQFKILSLLNVEELTRSSCVSRGWYKISHDFLLWKRLVLSNFSEELISQAVAIADTISDRDQSSSDYYQDHQQLYRICSVLISITNDLDDHFLFVCAKLKSSREVIAKYEDYKKNMLNHIRGTNPDKVLPTNQNIYYLDFYRKDIGAAEAQALAEVLKDEHCKLTSLNLSHNSISAAGAQALAEALKDEHCKLTSLALSGNNIGDAGAQALVEALKDEHCKLTSLDLRLNNIGAAGAQALAEALKDEHCKLTSLNLSYNVGPAGAQALAEALKDEHCKLTSLDLYENFVGAAGAQALAEAVINIRHTQHRVVKISGISNFDNLLARAEQEAKSLVQEVIQQINGLKV